MYMTKNLSNKLYLKKQIYGLRMNKRTALSMNERTTMLDHLIFFSKVINELLTIDVKIDEEDKVLILLNLLPQSYNHIVYAYSYAVQFSLAYSPSCA